MDQHLKTCIFFAFQTVWVSFADAKVGTIFNYAKHFVNIFQFSAHFFLFVGENQKFN